MIDETKSETEEQMDKTILSLEKKLQRIRTGRANPSLLESVEVDYYGSVSYTHLRAHETRHDLVCRLLLETNKIRGVGSQEFQS